MKVSVNWVKQFADVELPLDKLVDKIGAQLGAVEGVIDLGKRYKGVIVVRVVACTKHPDSNKLTVCTVDDSGVVKKVPRDTQDYVQIVCGASNVETGMLAAWIPPGVAVPSTVDKEPLVLESREIRGAMSHGMLASPKELDFGDDHSGLLHIDEDVEIGTPFAKAYKLDDHIIDIENKMFTHRPDLFGILGIAREIAGISGKSFQSPGWYLNPKLPAPSAGTSLPLQVKNELPKLVPRFCAIAIAGISVGPSPIWLQSYLMRVGIRPINNIVDLTNFVMYETGQPLHAYDYDKLGGSSLVIRHPKPAEILTLLGDKTVKLEKGTIVIATEEKAIGLGGVMGGAETEVDENTKNIVLECANFDMNAVRQAAMAYGLFTDAATRFTKNLSSLQNPAIIAKATDDILRLAAGSVASSLIDSRSDKIEPPALIHTTEEFINLRLGLSLRGSEMQTMLTNVEIKTKSSSSKLVVTVPFWRTDLEIAEDVIEEVGRLYGYDRLPLLLPAKTLAPAKLNPTLAFADRLREILAQGGASEILTYSFVRGSLIEEARQDNNKAFHIRNALSPGLQYYRLSLTPSLLEKIHPNVKAGTDEIALYELGMAHVRSVNDADGLPAELKRLGLVVSSRSAQDNRGAPYYHARRYSDWLAVELGLPALSYSPITRTSTLSPGWRPTVAAFEPHRSAVVHSGRDVVGLVGEPNRGLLQALKLPAYSAMLELDIDMLEKLAVARTAYTPPNRFPSLGYDLTLRSPADMPYQRLHDLIVEHMEGSRAKHSYGFNIWPIGVYQPDGNSRHKQTTWHIDIWHPDRTLTTSEVNELVDGLTKTAKTRLKVARV